MTTNNYQELSKFLESDDDVCFVNRLRDQQPIDPDMINSLAKECVELDALKCLIALIRGEVCNMHPTFDAGKLPDNGVTPLAYIAHCYPEDPQLIDVMLTKCGATSLANVDCTIGVTHGLPIHFLLINLSVMDHLYLWKRETSLIKLVMLLCVWKTKPILDSLGVLVKYTDSINVIAWNTLKNGGLKQFTALLLIAYDKVIAPFDNGLTIHHYITSEINLLQGELCLEKEELKCSLKDAQTFLTLFERISDDLSLYRSSMKKYVFVDDMIEDVCYLLARHGVLANSQDTCLYDCVHGENYLGRAMSDSVDSQPWVRVRPVDTNYNYDRISFSPSEVRPWDYSKPIKGLGKLHFGQGLTMPKCLQRRFCSPKDGNARDMSNSIAIVGNRVSPMPKGHIPRKLIHTIRFL